MTGRSKRRVLLVGAALLACLTAGSVVVSSVSAAPREDLPRLQGRLILNQEAGTGVATGSLAGTVTIQHAYTDLESRPNALRFADDLVITRRDGSTVRLTMEWLGTNFTTEVAVGGGIAFNTEPADEPGETYYALTVSMAPGSNHPEQVWTYTGTSGINP